jgi:hypothetical protein
VAQRGVLPEAFRQAYALAGLSCVPEKIIGKGIGAERVPVEGHAGERIEVATPADALWSMDPTEWNGNWAEWFALAGSSKAGGIEREDFCLWSMGDPDYADDRDEIEAAWDRARGTHGGYFHKALAQRNIHLARARRNDTTNTTNSGDPSLINSRVRITSQQPFGSGSGGTGECEAKARPIARNWVARVKGLLRELNRDQCDDTLYSYARLYAEILHEQRLATAQAFETAQELLEKAVPKLVRERGIDAVRRTTRRAFDHVSSKLKEASNGT